MSGVNGWQVVWKVVSAQEDLGMLRTTEVMRVDTGWVYRTFTRQIADNGGCAISEALVFVPEER